VIYKPGDIGQVDFGFHIAVYIAVCFTAQLCLGDIHPVDQASDISQIS
jgi:hypothetical protein